MATLRGRLADSIRAASEAREELDRLRATLPVPDPSSDDRTCPCCGRVDEDEDEGDAIDSGTERAEPAELTDTFPLMLGDADDDRNEMIRVLQADNAKFIEQTVHANNVICALIADNAALAREIAVLTKFRKPGRMAATVSQW